MSPLNLQNAVESGVHLMLNELAITHPAQHRLHMGLPTSSVTLTPAQIEELNKHLSTLRHDINGDLALIVAAAELIKLNPDLLPRMLTTLSEQPPKIRDRADKFSAAFEKMLGITRP